MEASEDLVDLARAFAFAARKHAGQRRKGDRTEPYINHLAEVAALLAEATSGRDKALIVAGLLHDSVEDGHAIRAEIEDAFGREVADVVMEVTDETLPEAARRRRQVETPPHKSTRAKMLKLADKISNLREVDRNPPKRWTLQRRRDYFEWGRAVVEGLRGVSPPLEAQFDEIYHAGMERLRE